MLSFELQGIDAAIARLGRLASLSGLDAELETAGDEIVTEAQIYPPERAGQRYVRTYRLQSGWRRSAARRGGNIVTVDVGNPTEYSPFVQGEEQAPVHRGRWKRLRAIGEDKLPALRARAGAWALRTWRGG